MSFFKPCASLLALLTATLLASAPAAATPLISAASSPSVTGSGLNGSYYDINVGSNTQADAVFTSTTPTGTFVAKTVDYGFGSSVSDSSYTVASYLGSNASNLVGTFSADLSSSLYEFTGYINITSAMDTTPGTGTIDVNFRVGSDDGMRLKIGGATIAEYNSPRGFGFTNGTASFQSAGLYAIDIVYWENGGLTGVDFQWETGSATSYQDVATANLYTRIPANTVPEPGVLALLGLGLGGLFAARRKPAA